MKRNVICNAFAFQEDYGTSMQMGGKADKALLEVYMKNIFVSLRSAKLQNPQDDVLLLTNAAVPDKYQKLFYENEIKIQVIPFEDFVMPKEFNWALAFFKLCALQHMAEQSEYEKVLLLDADTITMHSYDELWQEAEQGILLYGVGHTINHHDRLLIRSDYQTLYPDGQENIVHYGGELVGGTRRELQQFVKICGQVYNTIRESGFAVSKKTGDETILSIAAAKADRVVDAAPYLFRFWTEEFYLVSTVTVSNPVAIWHIPSEKRTGFIRMFRYYRRHRTFPEVKQAAKVFGIVQAKRPFNRYTLQNKVFRKLKKLTGRG